MTDKERAIIILEALDKRITINWNMEEYYLSAIIEGLREIRVREHGNN